MSSIREQCAAAVVTALNGAGKPAGVPTATRAFLQRYKLSATFKAVNVKLRESRQKITDGRPPGGARSPIRQWLTRIEIEHWAAGSASVSPDQAVDPLYAWSVKALAGQTLGGLASRIEEGDTRYNYEQGEYPVCMAATDFVVIHPARTDDAELRT